MKMPCKNKRRIEGDQQSKHVLAPLATFGIFVMVPVICILTMAFYRSLERQVYIERTDYLKEISAQVVSTVNTTSSAQWDLASIFSGQLTLHAPTLKSLADFISQEEDTFSQQGLSLLVFDADGNYYDAEGARARWTGSIADISQAAPEHQVEITTLPTTTSAVDEMVFILKMDQPVSLEDGGILTHVAVVRDMEVFNEQLQVPSFNGQGESYIISNVGTKIYRGQVPSEVIGDVYNVLKPMESMDFQYGSSYEELKEAVAGGEACSLEFAAPDRTHYYVTSSPMENNGWALLNIVPSNIVSARMQAFMAKALIGMGAIALIVVIAISTALFLVMRYRSSQRFMRKQAEANAALAAAAQAAEEASQAKTVFLSHMSHDIRTPINGIMGMADIATRNMTDPQRLADCLCKITAASRHLLSLVNDVLDMSRIESGKVQLENAPFHMEVLLDGCYSVIAGQALERKINLYKEFSGVGKRTLKGDELHLRQILINILGNAVKFTPQGGEIRFIAEGKEISPGELELTMVVADNGIGMSEEFQKKMFEPFSQEENGGRSKYQGTGLGMSIVKQLLDLMGGRIDVESSLGAGSKFTIHLCLPIEMDAIQEKQNASGEADLTGLRVMLVEDNELNMEIARYVLEDCGVEISAASNGQEALELFVNSPERNFDVILMDVMMPIMDGLEATRAIRACGKGDARSIPIIAMTANAYAEDRNAVIAAGMNRHLAKPLERSDLIQALQEVCK